MDKFNINKIPKDNIEAAGNYLVVEIFDEEESSKEKELKTQSGIIFDVNNDMKRQMELAHGLTFGKVLSAGPLCKLTTKDETVGFLKMVVKTINLGNGKYLFIINEADVMAKIKN